MQYVQMHLERSSYVTEGWFKYVDYYASTRLLALTLTLTPPSP